MERHWHDQIATRGGKMGPPAFSEYFAQTVRQRFPGEPFHAEDRLTQPSLVSAETDDRVEAKGHRPTPDTSFQAGCMGTHGLPTPQTEVVWVIRDRGEAGGAQAVPKSLLLCHITDQTGVRKHQVRNPAEKSPDKMTEHCGIPHGRNGLELTVTMEVINRKRCAEIMLNGV
jgi:hypothetical protein